MPTLLIYISAIDYSYFFPIKWLSLIAARCLIAFFQINLSRPHGISSLCCTKCERNHIYIGALLKSNVCSVWTDNVTVCDQLKKNYSFRNILKYFILIELTSSGDTFVDFFIGKNHSWIAYFFSFENDWFGRRFFIFDHWLTISWTYMLYASDKLKHNKRSIEIEIIFIISGRTI